MFKSIILEVIGEQRLHCESCELRVKRLLKVVPGIGEVRADSRTQNVKVLFDAARLEPAAIIERLREAGYETKVTG
jgi:copper chaperone